MTAPVSIIIPAHNQLEYCRQCIHSIQTHTDYAYRLILVDNASTDGVSDYFDTIQDAVVIHSKANLGFPGGVNLGLSHAVGHVLILNSDTIVPPRWLSRLVQALDQSPRIGIVGPKSNYVSGPQLVPDITLATLDAIHSFADGLHARHGPALTDVDRLVGFCMLIRDTAFRDVGRFDESFGIGNFEDDDYCLRARRAGYRVCIAEGCFVFHYGSRTFQSLGYDSSRFDALIRHNESIFNEKWGLPKDHPSRSWHVSLRLNREARAFLDAGNLVGALNTLKEAVAVCPTFEQNYNDVGVILWRLGEKEQAYRQFVRAVRLNPHHQEARSNLFDAAEALGRSDEAGRLLNPTC